MNKLLLLVVCLLLAAAPAGAQVGILALTTDIAGTDCVLTDDGPGTETYYVVHVDVVGATGVLYSAAVPACATGVSYITDIQQFPVKIGNSQVGASIGYGGCLSGTINAVQILCGVADLSPACCQWDLLTQTITDCGFVDQQINTTNASFIDGNGSCPCTVPTEETTWGHIKAIYEGE